MRKRLFRNLLQVIVALLLCLPQMALPIPVAASGDLQVAFAMHAFSADGAANPGSGEW